MKHFLKEVVCRLVLIVLASLPVKFFVTNPIFAQVQCSVIIEDQSFPSKVANFSATSGGTFQQKTE